MRPDAVNAFQALFTDADGDATGAGGNFTDDGLPTMSDRDLVTVTGSPVTALLTTTAADSETVTQRANSLLREAGWFVRCEGATDASLLGSILRVGDIVALNAAGAIHSGNYLVWSVRHRITAEKHEMKFVLVRNALGSPPPQLSTGGLRPMTDALLQDLLDYVRSRFFGKYRGVVVDVDASTMRVKASVPSVLGRSVQRLGLAMRALRRAAGRILDVAGRWQRGVDRIRGRRCLVSDLDRLLLEQWRHSLRRRDHTQNHHHRRRQPGLRQQRGERDAGGFRPAQRGDG